MSLLTKDKIIEIFYLADEFCKEYSGHIQEQKVSSSEGGIKRATANMKCPIAKS